MFLRPSAIGLSASGLNIAVASRLLRLDDFYFYVYIYDKQGSFVNTRWYFTALDFATGDAVYRKLTGTGQGYNNWQASLFLHPDGGAAYSITIFGLVMLRDGVSS